MGRRKRRRNVRKKKTRGKKTRQKSMRGKMRKESQLPAACMRAKGRVQKTRRGGEGGWSGGESMLFLTSLCTPSSCSAQWRLLLLVRNSTTPLGYFLRTFHSFGFSFVVLDLPHLFPSGWLSLPLQHTGSPFLTPLSSSPSPHRLSSQRPPSRSGPSVPLKSITSTPVLVAAAAHLLPLTEHLRSQQSTSRGVKPSEVPSQCRIRY